MIALLQSNFIARSTLDVKSRYCPNVMHWGTLLDFYDWRVEFNNKNYCHYLAIQIYCAWCIVMSILNIDISPYSIAISTYGVTMARWIVAMQRIHAILFQTHPSLVYTRTIFFLELTVYERPQIVFLARLSHENNLAANSILYPHRHLQLILQPLLCTVFAIYKRHSDLQFLQKQCCVLCNYKCICSQVVIQGHSHGQHLVSTIVGRVCVLRHDICLI